MTPEEAKGKIKSKVKLKRKNKYLYCNYCGTKKIYLTQDPEYGFFNICNECFGIKSSKGKMEIMTTEKALKTLEDFSKSFIKEASYSYQNESEGMAVIDNAIKVLKKALKR